MRGRTRCRLHGGATPQGIASPHYRGKGYSQAVPKHLKDIYEARFNDPELLSLHKEIALCDTRIEDLLTQISGRMGDCIHQVSEAFLAFQKAHAAGETGKYASKHHDAVKVGMRSDPSCVSAFGNPRIATSSGHASGASLAPGILKLFS